MLRPWGAYAPCRNLEDRRRTVPISYVRPRMGREAEMDSVDDPDLRNANTLYDRGKGKLAPPVRRALSALNNFWLLALGFLAWEALSRANPQLATTVPPPTDVFLAAFELAQQGYLQEDILQSLKRFGLGVGMAGAVGFPLGIALGGSRRFAKPVEPIVNFFRPIPPLAWIPLSILWFGVGDTQNMFIIFLAAVFPIILNTMEGMRDVSRQLVRAAQALGARRLVVMYAVLLPATLPQMFVGLRVGAGIGWMALVAAELVAATSGLGYLIQQGRVLFRPDYVIAGMVVIGLLGLMLDFGLRLLQLALMPWWRIGTR